MALPIEQQELDDYMADVLGIGQVDVRNALRLQGISTVNDFIGLTEDDVEDTTSHVT